MGKKNAEVPTWKRINTEGPIRKRSKMRKRRDRRDSIMQAERYQTYLFALVKRAQAKKFLSYYIQANKMHKYKCPSRKTRKVQTPIGNTQLRYTQAEVNPRTYVEAKTRCEN